MTGKRKTTASVSSVGADGKQPNLKKDTEIIANETNVNNLNIILPTNHNILYF